ncbi:hypothetical protein ACP70R_003344 [Stipagrostis hirtigluma subsp. patula]
MPPKDAAGQGAPGTSGGGGGADRLSGLPDRVLIRVLSHLRAWEAVRASFLSRRWRERGLWASVRTLDIRQPCACGREHSADGRRTEAFAAFVKNLLLRRRALLPLDALRLCWSHQARDGDASTWIAHAVRRGAREIELSGKHHAGHPSPEYMSFIVGDDIQTRLKILKLICVELDDTILAQLCSRCTSLEELELTDCPVLDQETPKIQSNLLKRLTMIRCEIPFGLLVYAPNLVSLQCSRPFRCVPWIENLGSPGIVNITQQTPMEYPVYTDIVSCNIKILKLSYVLLADSTLTQLCSRCTSLEELELKDCSVDGKEIRSNSLKCLAMIRCKIGDGVKVYTPNLVLLRCISPFGNVPWIQNMGFLVTATIVLDGFCFGSEHQLPQEEDDNDESDRDGNFFEDSDDCNDDESDHEYDTDDYYDPGCSSPGDDNCGGNIADKGCVTLAGDHLLCSLSNVSKMDLLADSGEVLRRELKPCPEFKNLKTLSLGAWCITPDLDALATILDSSPNLENLFLHLDMAFHSTVGINSRGNSFTCTNLKMVKITCSERDDMVHELVKLFSASGIAHEKIFVRRTASAASVKGGAGSQPKRKAQSEADKRAAKQRKAGS